MSKDMIGVRTSRNSPVLFVDASGVRTVPGDMVVIELSVIGDDDGTELEAVVVIGTAQMLHVSIGKLAGRVIRPA
ncbi:MAG: hypothetical protein OTJ98_06965 [Dehalococcoidia bacterium]|nr:hypothetical protein [Dehalococcoidia bacterium]